MSIYNGDVVIIQTPTWEVVYIDGKKYREWINLATGDFISILNQMSKGVYTVYHMKAQGEGLNNYIFPSLFSQLYDEFIQELLRLKELKGKK